MTCLHELTNFDAERNESSCACGSRRLVTCVGCNKECGAGGGDEQTCSGCQRCMCRSCGLLAALARDSYEPVCQVCVDAGAPLAPLVWTVRVHVFVRDHDGRDLAKYTVCPRLFETFDEAAASVVEFMPACVGESAVAQMLVNAICVPDSPRVPPTREVFLDVPMQTASGAKSRAEIFFTPLVARKNS